VLENPWEDTVPAGNPALTTGCHTEPDAHRAGEASDNDRTVAGARWPGPPLPDRDWLIVRHGMIPLVSPCRWSGMSGPSLLSWLSGRKQKVILRVTFVPCISTASPYGRQVNPVCPGLAPLRADRPEDVRSRW